jgi:hypothetical protein
MITAYGSERLAVSAMKSGAYDRTRRSLLIRVIILNAPRPENIHQLVILEDGFGICPGNQLLGGRVGGHHRIGRIIRDGAGARTDQPFWILMPRGDPTRISRR